MNIDGNDAEEEKAILADGETVDGDIDMDGSSNGGDISDGDLSMDDCSITTGEWQRLDDALNNPVKGIYDNSGERRINGNSCERHYDGEYDAGDVIRRRRYFGGYAVTKIQNNYINNTGDVTINF